MMLPTKTPCWLVAGVVSLLNSNIGYHLVLWVLLTTDVVIIIMGYWFVG